MSKKRKAEDAQETTKLAADIESHLADFAARQDSIDNTEDAASKIIQLLEFQRVIGRVKDSVTCDIGDAIDRRKKSTVRTRLKQTCIVLSALTLVGLPVLAGMDPDMHSHKSEAEKKQEVHQLTNMASFNQAVSDYQERCYKMLDDIVKDCDLGKISKSRDFTDAFKRHAPLRSRFEAAAAARAALGEEMTSSEKTPETAPRKTITLRR